MCNWRMFLGRFYGRLSLSYVKTSKHTVGIWELNGEIESDKRRKNYFHEPQATIDFIFLHRVYHSTLFWRNRLYNMCEWKIFYERSGRIIMEHEAVDEHKLISWRLTRQNRENLADDRLCFRQPSWKNKKQISEFTTPSRWLGGRRRRGWCNSWSIICLLGSTSAPLGAFPIRATCAS